MVALNDNGSDVVNMSGLSEYIADINYRLTRDVR